MIRFILLVVLVSCSRDSSEEVKATPALDKPRIDHVIEIPAGAFYAPRLACPDHATTPRYPEEVGLLVRRVVTEQTEPAFRINRRAVSCDEYAECVRANRCARSDLGGASDGCQRGFAIVTQEQASRYCVFREGRLPSYAQWNKAMLGARTQADAKAALERTVPLCTPSRKGEFPGCEQTSPYGLIYALHNPNMGEWTADTECIEAPPAAPVPLLINLIGPRMGLVAPFTRGGEFRCVW